MSQPYTDQPPASPAEALHIIERERARHEPDVAPFFLLWGAMWLSFGVSWFLAGTGTWSVATAGVTTATAVAIGFAASLVLGRRLDRGVDGPTRTAGMMYAATWWVTMTLTGALAAGLAASGEPARVFPSVFVFVAGTIYLTSAAFCRSHLDLALGVALQLVAIGSLFTPLPWNSLVMGVLGGGALLAVGLVRRARR